MIWPCEHRCGCRRLYRLTRPTRDILSPLNAFVHWTGASLTVSQVQSIHSLAAPSSASPLQRFRLVDRCFERDLHLNDGLLISKTVDQQFRQTLKFAFTTAMPNPKIVTEQLGGFEQGNCHSIRARRV